MLISLQASLQHIGLHMTLMTGLGIKANYTVFTELILPDFEHYQRRDKATTFAAWPRVTSVTLEQLEACRQGCPVESFSRSVWTFHAEAGRSTAPYLPPPSPYLPPPSAPP